MRNSNLHLTLAGLARIRAALIFTPAMPKVCSCPYLLVMCLATYMPMLFRERVLGRVEIKCPAAGSPVQLPKPDCIQAGEFVVAMLALAILRVAWAQGHCADSKLAWFHFCHWCVPPMPQSLSTSPQQIYASGAAGWPTRSFLQRKESRRRVRWF